MKKTHKLPARLVQGFGQVANAFGHRIPLYLLVIFIAVIYSSFSILRHQHFTSGAYDLGIFDQVIWQYSRFHAPYTSVRSNALTENLLGDHFHPILALLSPLYWCTDRVEALLIAQGLLFAIAIVPIFLFTEKRLGRPAAYLFVFAYAIFWGIQRAVEFDFHEIALAVPLLAWAIYFVDEKKWMPYFVCLGLLLLTKEDISVTVFFFGVYLVVTKQFKQGLISMAAGVLWFFAAIRIFIPFFIDPGTLRADRFGSYYRYWSYHQFGPDPWSALKSVVMNPLLVVKTLVTPVIKLQTYGYIFGPFLFLAFFSPLFILAIPLIAERFLSEGAHFWGMDFHYTAILAPVIVMASVDGLARIARLMKKERAGYLIIPGSVLVLAINLYLFPHFPLWNLTSPAYWQLSASDRVGHQAVSLIPRDASVTAQSPITPHLSHRRMIYVLNPLTVIPDADFIIASNRLSVFPFTTFQEVQYYLDAQQARGYRKVFEREGWLVLKRESLTGEPIPIYNDATFVEQLVPPSMIAGQIYDVNVTMKNTGVHPWTASGFYRLAILSRTNNWGTERVEVPSSVTPGSSVKFGFKVTAPVTPGTYSFRWGMVQEGIASFGQSAPEVMINVELPKE